MAVSETKWGDLAKQFDSSSGKFIFPKEGRTRLRLVLPEESENETQFYIEVTNSYGRKRWLVLAYPLQIAGQDLEEQPAEIRPAILTKSVMKGIFNLLAEGYELFDLQKGYGISIVRQGSGRNDTSYQVLPSKKAQPIPEDVEYPSQSIEELAEEFMKTSADRAGSRSGNLLDEEGGEEDNDAVSKPKATAAKKSSKAPIGRPSRKATRADAEDDDD